MVKRWGIWIALFVFSLSVLAYIFYKEYQNGYAFKVCEIWYNPEDRDDWYCEWENSYYPYSYRK